MIRVAFICDRGALRPTALAIWSVLRHASLPVEVIQVGLDLAEDDWRRLEAMVAGFPRARLTRIPFDIAALDGLATTSAHISRATFARLFLHRLTAGRVLYLDGDVLVTGDIAGIAAVPPGGAPVAAVGDFVALKWAARAQGRRRAEAARKLPRWAALSGEAARYFNAGVLLLELDAIAADPATCRALEDVATAASYALADQDHLNRVFAGRVAPLGPEWNCSWGRLAAQRRFMAQAGLPVPAAAPPLVIHYHGPAKPWLPLGLRRPVWQWPQVARYRRAQRTFNAGVPALAF